MNDHNGVAMRSMAMMQDLGIEKDGMGMCSIHPNMAAVFYCEMETKCNG